MTISDARYVSFTTYRASGDPVPVPVWIARLDDGRVGFTTDPTSWKVKRLAANPTVTLRACDVRGRVAPDAVEVTGTATVATQGPDHEAVMGAIAGKYWVMDRLLGVGNTLKRLIGRGAAEPCAVLISLDE